MSKVTSQLTNANTSRTSVRLTASTAGANPMLPGAPTIATYVDFSVEWIASSIRFQGVVRGDDFPNAEVFVLDSAGVGCLLFDGRTTGGKNTGPITRLPGAHAAQRLGTFFCTTGVSPTDLFSAPKTTCPITKMGT